MCLNASKRPVEARRAQCGAPTPVLLTSFRSQTDCGMSAREPRLSDWWRPWTFPEIRASLGANATLRSFDIRQFPHAWIGLEQSHLCGLINAARRGWGGAVAA